MIVSRREFVATTVTGLAAGACASLVTASVVPVEGRVRIDLVEYPGLSAPRGSLKIRTVGRGDVLYVLADGRGGYVTVSPICKHRGCTIDIKGEALECPCHGSMYRRDGSVLRGPTQEPLDRFETTVSDGVVTIELEVVR